MPDPRLILLRHGETEWSKTGQHTSFTDLPLTRHGRSLIENTSSTLLGPGLPIDPKRLRKIYVSPRLRAQETLGLLSLNVKSGNVSNREDAAGAQIEVQTTDLLTEMNYGSYEGLKTKEIYVRDPAGQSFGTWTTGYAHVNGESAADVQDRVDRLIAQIREEVHSPCWGEERSDVLFVAHGHVLRAVGARWLGLDIGMARALQLDAGGVSVLGYEHHRVEEPAVVRWNMMDQGTP
jgi:broad specificity phosphatase PhoE